MKLPACRSWTTHSAYCIFGVNGFAESVLDIHEKPLEIEIPFLPGFEQIPHGIGIIAETV